VIVNGKRVSLIALGSAAALGLLAWAFMPRPIEVETARVVRGPFMRTVDEDGKTRVRNRFVISSPLTGTLERITLDEGDRVESGAVVATIVPSIPALLDTRTEQELTARLEATEAQELSASANVGRAQAALDLANADAKRIENLAAKGFASAAERDTADLTLRARRKELDAAREERHAATHALDAARAALSRAMAAAKPGQAKPWAVRSPAAGVVLRVLQESERDVTTGTPLIEVGDPSDLEIVVDVLSSDAVSIAPGNRVLFEHWGGETPVEGRVRRVEPSAFTKISALGVEEQRVNVIIGVVSTDERWRAVGDGFRVDARIVVDERDDVLTVPVSALFREHDRWMTFVVSGGRAHKRGVTVGARGSQQAIVDAGLDEGETVVVYPGSSLDDGTRVAER
jgi:HlyD family secretion protein